MISEGLLEHLSRGQYNFLRPAPEEIRSALPEAADLLPAPQNIFLENEEATPLIGFPVQQSPQLTALEDAFQDYLAAEEEAHYAVIQRRRFDSRLFAARWERYRDLLSQAIENVTVSSYGQNYPGVFWLYHSVHFARSLKLVPKRLLRFDLKLGREHGDPTKYAIYFKMLDRITTLAYDQSQRLAAQTDEQELRLFPNLLTRMRDNVLIFTEDHIGPDLIELGSYFQGCLRIDGRDLRRRLAAVEEWHRWSLQRNPTLRSAAKHLFNTDPDDEQAYRLLHRPGYLAFLAEQPGYDRERLLSEEQIQVWEGLLAKLKEFEILHALRRMMVPLEREGDRLVSRDRSSNTTWVAGPPVLHLSEATRPIDFMAPWVVDPLVQRYGLVYDITEFSSILSMLGRVEVSALDRAFRLMFRFQRRINKLASSLQLRLEKYLGDGAFYSGRNARRMLVVAVCLQRYYLQFLEMGLPFNRGLRLALNYGKYRLLPLETGKPSGSARYEFFGHGIVELSRLATGKASQEIDDFKNFLIASGYKEQTVQKFFAPMLRQDSEMGSKVDESRRFYAYISANGTLINEGIVATEDFVRRLGRFERMYYAREHGRGYIAIPMEEEAGGRLLIGLRKLGLSRFKGLEQMPIYEIIDGGHWRTEDLKEIPQLDLMAALERLFAAVRTANVES